MNEKYTPFGGEKHVVNVDARLCGFAPHFYASVVFRSRDELDALIDSLTELRNGWDHPTGHIHLQDHALTSDRDPTRLEITFVTSTWADTEFETESRNDQITEARRTLDQL